MQGCTWLLPPSGPLILTMPHPRALPYTRGFTLAVIGDIWLASTAADGCRPQHKCPSLGESTNLTFPGGGFWG
jgi:hypothetical protein